MKKEPNGNGQDGQVFDPNFDRFLVGNVANKPKKNKASVGE